MNAKWTLRCRDCFHTWQVEVNFNWVGMVKCPLCESKDWDIVIQALNPSPDGIEPFTTCPKCGTKQLDLPPDRGKLLYQKCCSCDYERGRDSKQPTRKVTMRKELLSEENHANYNSQ